MKVEIKSTYDYVDIHGKECNYSVWIKGYALFEKSRERVIIISDYEDNVLMDTSNSLFYTLIKKQLIKLTGDKNEPFDDYE